MERLKRKKVEEKKERAWRGGGRREKERASRLSRLCNQRGATGAQSRGCTVRKSAAYACSERRREKATMGRKERGTREKKGKTPFAALFPGPRWLFKGKRSAAFCRVR